ncbi:hypothetical protein CJI51_06375 [Bifidobacteriaceae bacterium WP021]|nr:hypothetical protein CJI51_06375 [Bifidobacteriaceae bacterium WP021]
MPAVQVEDNSAPATPSAPVVPVAPAENPTVANTQKAVTPAAELVKSVSSAVASHAPAAASTSAAVAPSNNTSQADKSTESQVSEENSKKPEDNNGETEEVEEKTPVESNKPQAQASATAENKSSGNMLSNIMLGVLGVLTISGAAAAGVTVMRHRRLPRA